MEKNSNDSRNLELGFDVGHSSIGWAIVKNRKNNGELEQEFSSFELLGCGAVTFEADSCLAKKRREYRRQRRHIRSTRQRIKRMKLLLQHLKILSEEETPNCAWPWKLAAQVLADRRLLNWQELWCVLRWYAHNRGYDENRQWAENVEHQEEKEDNERLQAARELMAKYSTKSMAETICKDLGIDYLNDKKNSSTVRYKGYGAAFPRDIVVKEVRTILQKHIGKLKGVNEELIETLTGDNKRAWKTIECPSIKLPSRYSGGLLFGQLLPRFENRIINTCPLTGEKLPSKNCVEFYRFRWAMLLANITVQDGILKAPRPLTADERKYIDEKMHEAGTLTKEGLRKLVHEAVSTVNKDATSLRNPVIATNISTMFLTEEMEKALVFDSAQKIINSKEVQQFWHILPERLKKRFKGQWRRGKRLTLQSIREQVEKLDKNLLEEFDKAINHSPASSADNLSNTFIPSESIKVLKGRAPYSRKILQKAYEEVLEGKDPRKEGGCIFRSEQVRKKEMQMEISKRTNNHLVRHRLLILERLLRDIIAEYANGDNNRISKVTIEVNRDLRDFSGMTAKEIKIELDKRMSNFKDVEKYLAEKLADVKINGKPIKITGSLIRKARIAMDLNWTCPYTGIVYEPKDLVFKRVDLDHIIPQSMRPSNSLDSMVITFSEINRWKGQRLAYQFIEEEEGKEIPGMPEKNILTLNRYKQLVDNFDKKGHPQDQQRKKRRKGYLLLKEYTPEEFLPRDLTQTSQIVRLSAQIIGKYFTNCNQKPVIVSLPASITVFARYFWNIMGCLSKAVPKIIDENGEVRKKDEIRNITHLHHAVDACTLALASHFIPNNGRIWELILRKKLTQYERNELSNYSIFQFDSNNNLYLKELPEEIKNQISERLCECRVMQHIPKDMSGARLDETVWRVVDIEDTHPSARKLKKWCEKKNIKIPGKEDEEALIVCRARKGNENQKPSKILYETEHFWWKYDLCKKSKLFGLEPKGGTGKLKKLKAVKIVSDNYGLALDPEPKIIRGFNIITQVNELKKRDKPIRIIRKGDVIKVNSGTYKGIWKVLSIKDKKSGLYLYIIKHYLINSDLTKPFIKDTALFKTILKGGITIMKNRYTGFNYIKECHSISST